MKRLSFWAGALVEAVAVIAAYAVLMVQTGTRIGLGIGM